MLWCSPLTAPLPAPETSRNIQENDSHIREKVQPLLTEESGNDTREPGYVNIYRRYDLISFQRAASWGEHLHIRDKNSSKGKVVWTS